MRNILPKIHNVYIYGRYLQTAVLFVLEMFINSKEELIKKKKNCER